MILPPFTSYLRTTITLSRRRFAETSRSAPSIHRALDRRRQEWASDDEKDANAALEPGSGGNHRVVRRASNSVRQSSGVDTRQSESTRQVRRVDQHFCL